MKVLVIDGGGRGHAIVRKIHEQNPEVELYAAPGNPGMAEVATCVPIETTDIKGLTQFAQGAQMDLTVVGNEDPLMSGIGDRFKTVGLKLFGPMQSGAFYERDKVGALELMHRFSIPTGWHRVFTTSDEVWAFLSRKEYPVVLKNPFPAKGKGAFVCFREVDVTVALEQIERQQSARKNGYQFLVMEYLKGQEVSITVITDGTSVVYLAPSLDHKRLLDGDLGPMTGGMGAVAPVPFITPDVEEQIHKNIVLKLLHAIKMVTCTPYKGVLYIAVMLTARGPRVIEINCRFGDPEAQVILPVLNANLLDIFLATCEGRLKDIKVPPPKGVAACTVLTSRGYGDGEPETGKIICGLDELRNWSDVHVCHAGTYRRNDGDYELETASGRVVNIVGVADDILSAMALSDLATHAVSFDGMHRRHDIGHKVLVWEEERRKRLS